MKISALFIFIVIVGLTGCEKTNIQIQTFYVASESDLEIKEKPDMKSKTIDKIPFGGQVSFIEAKGGEKTILGTTGKWNKIVNKGNTAWLFGNLSPDKIPDEKLYLYLKKKINDAKSGDVIKIVAGKYLVNTSDELVFEGKDNITIRSHSSPAGFAVDFVEGNILTIKNCNNIKIEGISFYINGIENTTKCITIESSRNISVTSCVFYGDGFEVMSVRGYGVDNINISGNIFHKSGQEDGTVVENSVEGTIYFEENINWSSYLDPLYELVGEYEGTNNDDHKYRFNLSRTYNDLQFNLWNEGNLDGASLLNGMIREVYVNDDGSTMDYYFTVNEGDNDIIVYLQRYNDEFYLINGFDESMINKSTSKYDMLDTFYRKE